MLVMLADIMIQSFQHKRTKKIYEGERVNEFSIER